MLDSGDVLFGSFALLGDPQSVEIMATRGFDLAVIDMEHTAFDLDRVLHCVRAAQAFGIVPIVRIPDIDHKLTMRVMDMGVEGIMLPTVLTASRAEEFASHLAYRPMGERGSCSYTRGANYGMYSSEWGRFTKLWNEGVVSLGLLETASCIKDMVGIVESLDVTLVGRSDLSASLGVPGKHSHEEVEDAVARHHEVARTGNRCAGIIVSSPEEAHAAVGAGYRVIFCSMDLILLANAYQSWSDSLGIGGPR